MSDGEPVEGWPGIVPPPIISGDEAVLQPRGEFDMANQRDLDAAIHHAVISGPQRVVVDLGEVTFIDTSVVHTLLRGQRVAEAKGCELQVVNATPSSAIVLDALGIGPPLWDGVEDAEKDTGEVARLP